MATATLQAIRDKVRKITRSPSPNLLSDAVLDEYIDTFIAYDFPESLRLFTLRTTFSFYTSPYVDRYETSTILNDPLQDFKDVYTTVGPPVYVAGVQATWMQDRNQFYNLWPTVTQKIIAGTGNGAILSFTGTLSSMPLMRTEVLFTSIDVNGFGLVLKDVPYSATNGNLVVPDSPASGVLDPVNDINYITGAFTITFNTPPAASTSVYAQVYPIAVGKPTTVLYYNNMFFVRPVPDMPYKITMDAYVRPTQLLNQPAAEPNLEQWWQYIAYGASKKILEDRMDMDTVAMIMPEFMKQERLVLRRTIVQQSNQRTPTIYSGLEGTGYGWNNEGNNF